MSMRSLKEMIAVMQAAEAGKPIEGRSEKSDMWELSRYPTWNWDTCDFRIASTKPSIDWNAVAEPFDALATDGNSGKTLVLQRGEDFSYYDNAWRGYRQYAYAEFFSSFTPGTCAPEDSLVLRPNKWKKWNQSPVQPTCDYVDVLREGEGLPVLHVIPNTVNWKVVTQWRLSGEG